MGTAKTNAARLLDQLGVSYELREYEVDPEDLSAATVAARIGFPLEQTFKTLVVRGERTGVCLAVIPGDMELDLKALARAAGDRKMDTVPLKEVQPLDGIHSRRRYGAGGQEGVSGVPGRVRSAP